MIGKQPALTVDIVIATGDGIVFIKRGNEPFKGMWALPGGFVDYGETVEAAAIREAKEETCLDVELVELLGVYSDPSRDPRGHTVSVVYLAKIKSGELRGADDAAEAAVFRQGESFPLAFDHEKIYADALVALKRRGLF